MSDRQVQAYMEIIAPYYEPHGLVEVWAEGRGNKWTRIRINRIPNWIEAVGPVNLHATLQQFKIHPTPYSDRKREEPYISPILFEFDSSEEKGTTLEDARKDAAKLCFYINSVVNPPRGCVRVWYSGSRGFHVTIDPRLFGVLPNPNLHIFYKALALYHAELLGLRTLDSQVYSYRRNLRIPNTKRSVTWDTQDGDHLPQYKVELTINELDMMSVEDIRRLATKPREPVIGYEELSSITMDPSKREWLAQAYEEYDNEMKIRKTVPERSVAPNISKAEGYPVCMTAILGHNFAVDKRNKAALTIATYIKDSGRSRDEAHRIMSAWTGSIPWATHKRRERLANARAIITRVFNDKNNEYVFACQFARACSGTSPSGGEITIPCTYNNCKFMQESEGDQRDPPVIDLSDFLCPEYMRTSCRSRAHLVGYMERAFSVPAQVRFSCTHIITDENTHISPCANCRMPMESDQAKDPEMLDEPLTRVMDIDLLKRGLSLIDVTTRTKRNMVRSLGRINKKCSEWRMEEMQTATIRQIMLKPPAISEENVMDQEAYYSRKQLGFLITREDEGMAFEENSEVEVSALPVASPKDQSIHLAISSMKSSASDLDRFQMSDELKEQLIATHRVPRGSTVERKILDRVAKISSHIGIRGRDDLVLAMDLVFHSPPVVRLSENDGEERGWMQLLVVGDPGQAKSSVAKGLMAHYRLGRSIECGAASRTGIVYSIDINKHGRMLVWGVIPQEDRRLVVIDEFHQLKPEDAEMMTGIRSSGIVKVNRVVSGTAPSRTRMIFLANPPGDGTVSHYSFGVQAITSIMKKQQDVRRLDLAIVCRSGDVPLEDINTVGRIGSFGEYEPNACRNLVLWAWTRKSENIKWTDAAIKILMDRSVSIARLLYCDIAIVEGSDMRHRLARIAQAVAAMCYSSDESGENLWIFPEHVNFACDVFMRMLTTVGAMNLHVYAKSWQARNSLTKVQKGELASRFLSQPWFPSFCDRMLIMSSFRKDDINDLVDLCQEDFRDMWRFLIRSNMVEQAKGGRGFQKTPKFTGWLSRQIRSIDAYAVANTSILSSEYIPISDDDFQA